ncbi:MAG: enoyl-CoA hydratase/isomerase family protein [Alphaproteobacteria bacterium]|nr:enoyl-CoA hydratase/isomerase family protein [Alphaproteobacteria bacterium]
MIPMPPRIEPDGLAALTAALRDLRDGQVAVLVGASPETFCLGMDLARYAHGAADELAAPLTAYRDALLALRTAPCPTVAVVRGAAMGGGLGLAAACDVVLASPDARFGLPEATFGLVPGMVLAVVGERISPARVRRMALQGDSVDAEQALAWGLVDQVETDPDRAAARWVRRLSRVAPGAVRSVREVTGALVEERLTAGLGVTRSLLARPDVQARVRRFVDEGVAPWEPLVEDR